MFHYSATFAQLSYQQLWDSNFCTFVVFVVFTYRVIFHYIFFYIACMMCNVCSGVARAFPGGQAGHPEDQNEEENEEYLRKNE